MEFRNDDNKTPIYPKFKYDDPYKSESYYAPRNIKLEMRDNLKDMCSELAYDIDKKHLCKYKLYEGCKKILNRPPYIKFTLTTASGLRKWIVKLQYLYLVDGAWFLISFPFNDDHIIIRPKDLFKYDFLDIMRGFVDKSLRNNGLGGEWKPTCFQIPDEHNLYLKLLKKKIIKEFNYQRNVITLNA